jgi:hypothetical protein
MVSLNLSFRLRVVLVTGVGLAGVVALASDASAQGTGGSTGAVASIPGSVVRGHEQQPGLFSILANPPPPSADAVSKPKTIRRGENPPPSK